VTIRYDAQRCIHAAECVHGLPAVFDPRAKPWVNADGADAAAIVATVDRCPTGALQIERGDRPASVSAANTATLTANGPTYLRGDIELALTADDVRTETRLALCRCGASQNKPYCDNSHRQIGFGDAGALPGDSPSATIAPGGKLTVSPRPNGPLKCTGPLILLGTDGCTAANSETFLCRCGASANKPYCDGTHKKIGFIA